jgi:hypothetical protein
VATDTLTASEVDLDRLAVDTVRVLAMDAIHKAGSGHPGTAMALAPWPPMCCGPGSCGSTRSTRNGSTGTGSCSRPATRGAAVCGVAPDRVPAGRPGPQAAAPVGVPDPGPPRARAHGHAAVVATVHGADGSAIGGPKAGCKATEETWPEPAPNHPDGRDTHARSGDSSQLAVPVEITC